jgi:nicotinamide-nucleotide amidase
MHTLRARKPMIGEVISIGDEITSGQRLDTNSQWLSTQLGDLGVRVLYHTTVADEMSPMVDVLRVAAARADVIVATGGLGPTADDLTRQALAEVAGVELVQDDGAIAHIRALFARRKREMPERNTVQALFPVGSHIIPNPHGTAPGIDMDLRAGDLRTSRIFSLPGVPAEMKEMWAASVAPSITDMLPPEVRRIIRHRVIKCFGVGESDLEAMLPDMIRRDRYPRVGITVSQATISLRITAEEATPEACFTAMESTVETIHGCLKQLVYGEGDQTELQHVVARMLAERGDKIAVAEGGTAGVVAEWLHETAGGETVLRGGITVGDDVALVETLGVPRTVVEAHGPFSAETATAMAERCRAMFRTDHGLAITAIPRGEAETFHIALATPRETLVRPARTIGHPDLLLPRSAKQALDLVRLTLLNKNR